MSRPTLRITTRGSKLALWQSEFVAKRIRDAGMRVEFVVESTQGDRVQDRFLHELGGKGLFVRELEDAMLNDRADVGVHSLKDLPARLPPPFILSAILPRHTPRDVLIFRPEVAAEKTLPPEITVKDLLALAPMHIATSSLRRQSLLKSTGADLKISPVRGNVDTRLRKLYEGQWDALILAEAAITRLGLTDLIAVPLATDWFVPAPAQGALAIESLPQNPFTPIVRKLNHSLSYTCVHFERQILAALGGDCTMPMGCYMRYDSSRDETVCTTIVLDHTGKSAQSHRRWRGHPESHLKTVMLQEVMADLTNDGLEEILHTLATTQPDLGKLSES